ncbi:class I SAM-dependent methyltransferase [Stratiformator vulcanicus]|nr:class I SAM-dependent methyltransferase [Stratiformator vulcanicus]
MPSQTTRGHGLLEPLLARLRADKANALIDNEHRQGAILDIGCGTFPYFLTRTEFERKVGVDRFTDGVPDETISGIELHRTESESETHLSFEDGNFNVVTMLAVFEHIPVEKLVALLNEVDRVLRPGGMFVMTTPAGFTQPILDMLAWLKLVSEEEIDEHEQTYSHRQINQVISETPLGCYEIERGSFEFGLNLWLKATKPMACEFAISEPRRAVQLAAA